MLSISELDIQLITKKVVVREEDEELEVCFSKDKGTQGPFSITIWIKRQLETDEATGTKQYLY